MMISKKIEEARKSKGLTQEELAAQSMVSVRTIQRIENSESEPRGKTLKMICNVLQIEIDEVQQYNQTKNWIIIGNRISNILFMILFNIVIIGIFGYFTMDVHANMNSRVAAYLLSFFFPMFIVQLTLEMNRLERLIKFGLGFILYFITTIFVVSFPHAIVSGLFLCMLIATSTLFYGKEIKLILSLKKVNRK